MKKSLAFILAYLKNRKQKSKVPSTFSDYLNTHYGVPQRSNLGLLLFIIFIADLFYINGNLDYASYGDDKTSYVCKLNFAEPTDIVIPTIQKIFAWFKEPEHF